MQIYFQNCKRFSTTPINKGFALITQGRNFLAASLRSLRKGKVNWNGACVNYASVNLFSGELALIAQSQIYFTSCLRKLRKLKSE